MPKDFKGTDGASGPTLILGANGKTGRRTAERLRAVGREVRLASRSTSPRFDWNDVSTWAPALRGRQSAYVPYQPDLAAPQALWMPMSFGVWTSWHLV